ncbi:hypothetical protein CKM354_000350400 [Cercospora kikuchii]|uniref:Uncharacterized protein n=1 Tax=Cercospora kikuchii TaxID=84275 RepID=A0A9P3CBE7_9PEZI|nr:uncharacterized protein CKM354_000350400 [Cercospora kikuchii]GIZ40152.1 hypothetical protein CKM354_000350400 [Cercospora kikuchii]
MSTFKLDNIYCEFGFNFDSLRKSAMQDVLEAYYVPYNKRSTNAQLAMLLEKHYADMLLRRGQLSDEYLAPDFDPFTYTATELRQILSIYDLKYREKALRAELARLFDSNARAIRAARSYKHPQRSAQMDNITERIARSNLKDYDPNGTASRTGPRPPRSPLFADSVYSSTR